MRMHSKLFAVLALSVAMALPARADFVVGARIGDSFVVGGSDGLRAQINLGSKRHKYRHYPYYKRERTGPTFGNPGELHSRIGTARQRARGEHRPQYPRYYYPVRRVTVVEREEPRPVEPTVKPSPPAKPAVVVEKSPPNPAGHARLVLARGAQHASEIAIGAVVPANVPHVTLDPLRFDLPAPPAGQIYARVRGQVFLIDSATRLVHDRIEPAS